MDAVASITSIDFIKCFFILATSLHWKLSYWLQPLSSLFFIFTYNPSSWKRLFGFIMLTFARKVPLIGKNWFKSVNLCLFDYFVLYDYRRYSEIVDHVANTNFEFSHFIYFQTHSAGEKATSSIAKVSRKYSASTRWKQPSFKNSSEYQN